MSSYTIILNQFTIYVGSTFLIGGVLGNLINAGVFHKNNLRNPTTFLLFLSAWFNVLFISVGLLTRIVAAGLNIDIGFNNLGWCKVHVFLIDFSALGSVVCICYATIDQYFVTSQHERLRRLSKISITIKVICILILLVILYAIPFVIFSNLILLGGGRIVCTFISNVTFTKVAAYFIFPVIGGIIPITLLITFGILTYHNVSLLKNARNRERAQHHLTSMILLHIIFTVIASIPYASYNTYSAITLNIIKSSNRQAIESFISNIVSISLVFPYCCSFFVYYAASTTYREQVKIFFHILTRTARVAPQAS